VSRVRPNYAWVVAALVGLLLSGCAGRAVTTDVYKDPVFSVRLRHTLDEGRKPVDRGYQHPLSVSPEEVKTLLRAIRLEYQAGLLQSLVTGSRPRVAEAFSEEESQRMAEGLAAAFARATPADRIEFQFNHRRGVFSAGTTTGVLFAKGNRIEIVLGNYRASPRPKGGGVERGFDDPLEDIGTGSFRIVPGPNQELRPADGPVPEHHGLVMNYTALLASGSEPSAVQEPLDEDGIEEKLEILERLREKGLISQEEYDEKRKAILEAF
jgi:hypothetical protein